jgi:tryptophan halogenase
MTQADRDDYNRRFARQVDDFRTFVNTHYLGGRSDTPFWRDVAQNRIHEETRERIALWQREMPRREHFPSFLDGLPHVEAQLHYPVLDGLGLLDAALARKEMDRTPTLRAFARKTYEDLRKEYRAAADMAISHAEFLAIARGERE